MERRCCVCNKYLGEKEGPKDMVSHGFCEPCLEKYKAEMMADLAEFDKKADVPIGVTQGKTKTAEAAT